MRTLHLPDRVVAKLQSAWEDLPNMLFVMRYAVEIPKTQQMDAFLKQLGKEVGHES